MNGKKSHKVFFIAEIASSHNGSKKNLIELVNNLLKTNIDAIKLQIFNYKELAHPSYKFFLSLKKVSFDKKFIEKIILKILKKKEVVLEPFDKESFQFCKKFKKSVSVKISSSDNNNKELLNEALKIFKNVFFSINSMNIRKIKKNLGNNINNRKIILTYGFQSFPTNINDLRLNFINKLNKKFQVCYADHTNANSLVDNILTINRAIQNGSKFIEKHVTLNRNKGYPDSDSSLELNEIIELLKFFRKKIPNKNKISSNEIKYSKFMARHAVLKKNVKKNQLLKYNDLSFLRTGFKGIMSDQINNYLGNFYNRNLKKNEILKKEFLNKK